MSTAARRDEIDPSVPPVVAAARNPVHRFVIKAMIFYVRKIRRRIYALWAGKPLDRAGLEAKATPQGFWRFGEPETVAVDTPEDFIGELHPRHRWRLGETRYERPFVAELRDAVFVFPWCLTFADRNEMVVENCLDRLDLLDITLKPKSIVNLYRARLAPQRHPEWHLDIACPLVNCFSTNRNYFHWTTECLTRIEGLRHYEEQTGRRVPIVLESSIPSFKAETLELLGVDRADIVHTAQRRYWYWADRLIVPSVPRRDNTTSPRSCRWLKERLRRAAGVTEAPAEGPELLYISRRNARARRVRNEDEILDWLTPLGFEVCLLEEMSVVEQIRVFSRARVVVGPHGAGFTNMIYGDDLTIVEFFGRSYVDPVFFTLGRGLGYGYQKQVCPEPEEGEIEVDPELLKRQLDAALERQEIHA